MALTLKVGTIEQGVAYCTRERDAAPFRPASVAELHPGKAPRVAQLCALEALADRGSIRAEQLRAGREIRDYWRVWTCAFSARISGYGAARFGEQAEVIPPSLRSLVGRYRAWAQAAEADRVRGDLTALQLVLDLCVDGRAMWWMRRAYRISDVRALRVCQVALHDYARRAGWLDERNAA
jgi:hypothetical protein